VRISDLSERSGVAPASIKYYVRERLLPPGEQASGNQTTYSDAHLARLRLIRAFLDVGGLSISSARAVFAAIDDDVPFAVAAAVASTALPNSASPPASDSHGAATLAALLERLGWHAAPTNPGFALAARVIDDYTALGRDDLLTVLPAYAESAMRVAEADLDATAASGSPERMTETVVIGTVLGDSLFAGLRRIAHEHVTYTRFPVPPEAFNGYHQHPEETR
jgi:DNA-binding transcriptional MerR regulator